MDVRRSWNNPGFRQTDSHPVVCVSWNEAHLYLRWLNGKVAGSASPESGPYHLPSEAEWEYVARAGSQTPYSWGTEASHDYANYGLEQCYPCGVAQSGKDRWLYTSPGGAFMANAFGLYDTSGNVWQWTEDCMSTGYVGAPTDGSASTSSPCHSHVLRGGSWLDPSKFVRVAIRNPWPADDHNNANGFRVVRALD
jgi:formylglycine-generating enzyme required for sulfatase activity